MAKHKGRLHRPTYTVTASAGALAAGDVIASGVASGVAVREYLIGLKGPWAFDGFTSGEGPVQFGVAHADYTSAEIEEALEAAGSWDLGNKVAQEQGKRLVRTIGIFKPGDGEGFANGEPVWTKCGWYVESGDAAFQVWQRNLDLAAPLTTGGILKSDGTAVLRPVT